MEQYWMPKKLDFKNLRLCLDNYSADFLYIRLVGSAGGTVKINEKLKRRGRGSVRFLDVRLGDSTR